MSVNVTVQDGVARLVIDHPPLNILTREVLSHLRAALTRLESERDLRVLLLSAAGKHFSAGADVGEHLPPHHEALIPEFLETVDAIATFHLPVIAAVQGRCLGGGFELIQAADLIVASERAMFGQPEIMLGVFPPAACALLPHRVPYGVAAEIVMTGESMSAGRLLQAGLVQRVVPEEDLENEALDLARGMARHSAETLRITKRTLRACAANTTAALEVVGKVYLDVLMDTADAQEGLNAFLQKRAPAWSHQ